MRGLPVFTMPAHATEQSPAHGVDGMILVGVEAFHNQQQQLEDLTMKVSELVGRVDTLIGLATQYKNASTSPAAAALPADDPEVAALASRIDDAIAVLQGTATTAPVAPATPPATHVTPPAVPTGVAVDPNALIPPAT